MENDSILSLLGSLASIAGIILSVFVLIKNREGRNKVKKKKKEAAKNTIISIIENSEYTTNNHLRKVVKRTCNVKNPVIVDEIVDKALLEIIKDIGLSQRVRQVATTKFTAFKDDKSNKKSDNFKRYAFRTAILILGFLSLLLLITAVSTDGYQLYLLQDFLHPIPILFTGVLVGLSSVTIGWMLAQQQAYLDQKYSN